MGASLGFALCLAFGIGFLALASLAYGLFEGDNERIFQFCCSAGGEAREGFLVVSNRNGGVESYGE